MVQIAQYICHWLFPLLYHCNMPADSPNSQTDVGCCRGSGEEVVVGLAGHVWRVDGVDEISAGHSDHGGVHCEFQLPRAGLRVRVHTGEPKPARDGA